MNKRNTIVKIFTLTIFPVLLFGQSQQSASPNLPTVILPSPNAASLGVYGQVPVSFFSGLPQISVPLGSLSLDGINVGISLNYHGGGIQPDQHPTWVGLGWDLNAGGVITRKINGGADEGLAPEDTPPTQYIYYDHATTANNPNWDSPDTMAQDALMVNPSFTRVLPSPDEFTFNFGGYTGSFFYDQTGHWSIRSESPLHLKIIEKLSSNFSLPPQAGGSAITLPRIFYEFDITLPDGTEYIFGGTTNSIEFSRPPGVISFYANYAVYASAWYLTKIITPRKREIDFSYDRDKLIVPVSSSYINYAYKLSDNSQSGSGGDGDHITIINPCYLTAITSPGQQFYFFRSVSNELPYSYQTGADKSVSHDMDTAGLNYKDLTIPGHPLLPTNVVWYKLDSVCEYNGSGSFLRKMAFSYTENTSTRLILNNVQEFSQNYAPKPPYTFIYNTIPLPPYNSKETDHWGYYNGVNFFNNYPVTTQFDSSYVSAYTASRAPNPSYVQAGVLTSVQYPTGGKTTFIYEPNDYAKVVNIVIPQSTISSVAKQTGAGIRVSKISNYDAAGNLLESKQYFYVSNYNLGDTTSSGILGGTPEYLEKASNLASQGYSATLSYWYWYSTPIEPLGYTNGSAVTYSEVVEKLLDGSYTIYDYSNQDQAQYRDQPPLATLAPDPYQWKLDPTISLSLDRGKLLEQRVFKSSNTLLKDTKYQYDESSAQYQEAVRIINLVQRQYPAAIPILFSRATAYLIYTFPRFLTKQTDIVYDINGQNPVTTVRDFGYNRTYRQVATDTATNSKNQAVTTQYFYPYDMGTGIYPAMTDSNMIAPVVESVQQTNSVQTLLSKSSYYSPYAGIFLPDTIQIQNEGFPLQTRIAFNQYDNYGNILEQQKSGSTLKEVYIWGYRGQYPVAKIIGSNYAAVSAALGQANLTELDSAANYSDATIRSIFSSLRTSLPSAQIISYTYNPPIGITSQTDPAGITIYYEYDDFGRLLDIKDTNGNAVKLYDYHYKQ